MQITYKTITDYLANNLSNQNLSIDFESYMNYFGMAKDRVINNRNLVAYLANFLNFMSLHGRHVYNLDVSFAGNIYEGLEKFFCNFIEENVDENGKVKIPNYNGFLNIMLSSTLSSLIKGNFGMLNQAAKIGKFVCDELCATSTYDIRVDYNFNPLNGVYAYPSYIDSSSPLSNDYILKDVVLSTLMENLVLSKAADNKIAFTGDGISQLSALCSSSSSSSSSDFIAYMKLD